MGSVVEMEMLNTESELEMLKKGTASLRQRLQHHESSER